MTKTAVKEDSVREWNKRRTQEVLVRRSILKVIVIRIHPYVVPSRKDMVGKHIFSFVE